MLQVLYYFIFAVLVVGCISMVMRGFFWKYLKVRMSMGKNFLIKIRSPLRDYFAIGHVEDGFIVYKMDKEEIRIPLSDGSFFYKSMAVNWIDIDQSTFALCKTDYTAVEGYDAKKYSHLLTRAMMRPSIQDNKQKIMLFLIIGISICVLVIAVLTYMNYSNIQILQATTQTTQTAIARPSVI